MIGKYTGFIVEVLHEQGIGSTRTVAKFYATGSFIKIGWC